MGEENQFDDWVIQAKDRKFSAFNDDSESEWKEPFYFIQGADIQFGLIQRYIEKNPVPGWNKEIRLAEEAVMRINQMKPRPKFFVICGDLCDAIPGQDDQLYEDQVKTFKSLFAKVHPDIPLVCVCGNHDIGDVPTKETISRYHSNYGDDYFSFWCGGILFIIINSQFYFDSTFVQEEAKLHEHWLEKQLGILKATRGKKRAVIFQHIPWFINSVEEDDPSSYFAINIKTRKIMLDKFKDAGVVALFCGHYHRNAGSSYKGMDMVVTSAMGGQLGLDKSGVRVVRVLKTEIHHTYFEMDSIPENVDL